MAPALAVLGERARLPGNRLRAGTGAGRLADGRGADVQVDRVGRMARWLGAGRMIGRQLVRVLFWLACGFVTVRLIPLVLGARDIGAELPRLAASSRPTIKGARPVGRNVLAEKVETPKRPKRIGRMRSVVDLVVASPKSAGCVIGGPAPIVSGPIILAGRAVVSAVPDVSVGRGLE